MVDGLRAALASCPCDSCRQGGPAALVTLGVSLIKAALVQPSEGFLKENESMHLDNPRSARPLFRFEIAEGRSPVSALPSSDLGCLVRALESWLDLALALAAVSYPTSTVSCDRHLTQLFE